MAYNVFHPDEYLREIQAKKRVNAIAQPIIDQYYEEYRAKLKPSVEELPPTANENDIRLAVTKELSQILKGSNVSNVVESLSKANDLRSFYRFSKPFLTQIKDIRNLDASFLLDLWAKYKSKLLIKSEAVEPTAPFQDSRFAEYERSEHKREHDHKKHLVSQIRAQQAAADALNYQIDQQRINNYKKKAPSSISIPGDVLSYRSAHQSDPFLGKHYNPAQQVRNMLEALPYGYQTAKFKKKGPEGTSEFTKISRKGPAHNSLLLKKPESKTKLSGTGIIGVPYLARR
jgi:hypothetical protein